MRIAIIITVFTVLFFGLYEQYLYIDYIGPFIVQYLSLEEFAQNFLTDSQGVWLQEWFLLGVKGCCFSVLVWFLLRPVRRILTQSKIIDERIEKSFFGDHIARFYLIMILYPLVDRYFHLPFTFRGSQAQVDVFIYFMAGVPFVVAYWLRAFITKVIRWAYKNRKMTRLVIVRVTLTLMFFYAYKMHIFGPFVEPFLTSRQIYGFLVHGSEGALYIALLSLTIWIVGDRNIRGSINAANVSEFLLRNAVVIVLYAVIGFYGFAQWSWGVSSSYLYSAEKMITLIPFASLEYVVVSIWRIFITGIVHSWQMLLTMILVAIVFWMPLWADSSNHSRSSSKFAVGTILSKIPSRRSD